MSLRLTYSTLQREVGRFLGYGRTAASWSSDQTRDVDDIISSGLRSFYWPNVGEERYIWSFLKKLSSITTASATSSYDMPIDFGGGLKEFTYAQDAGKRYVSRVSEEEVRTLYSSSMASGAPRHFALRMKDAQAGSPTRYEVVAWPVPDAAYVLSFRYAVEPSELSESNPYPLGSAVHSECILEACLAAAEKTIMPEDTNGLHAQKFADCLQASVKLDMEML